MTFISMSLFLELLKEGISTGGTSFSSWNAWYLFWISCICNKLHIASLPRWDEIASSPLSPKWDCPSPWHDIELTSRLLAKIHLEWVITVTSLPLSLSVPSFFFVSSSCLSHPFFFLLQLTVIERVRIVCSSWQPVPCCNSIVLTLNYVAIIWSSGIRGAHVKVRPCEKTPAGSPWPLTCKWCKWGFTTDTESWLNLSAFRQNEGPYRL